MLIHNLRATYFQNNTSFKIDVEVKFLAPFSHRPFFVSILQQLENPLLAKLLQSGLALTTVSFARLETIKMAS